MKQMSTLTLGKNIYEINDAIARKLITELSKNLDNIKVVDGKSAYEIAVENGFIGSETDWLASLKGEYGDTGNGISDISKTSTTNNIDTYTITFTNGNTINYNVTNGVDGVGISDISYKETDSNGNYIYTIILTDNNSYDIIVPKGDIGIGIQGEQGLSAYQVAVQNGFSGTESEWLESLKGEEYNDEPIWKVQGEYGAKNLLKKPYNTPTPYVTGGITFSDNEDGGIIINGKSIAYIILQIIRELEALPHGNYILSVQEDLPSGVVLQFGYVTTSGTVTFVQKGYNALTTHSMKVTIDNEFDGNLVCIRIGINSGTTVDNLVVHPMLRYATDTDDTWQPYAMTNKQLTDAVYNNGEEIANESTVSQELKANYFYLFTNAVESLTITLPSNRRPWNEFNFAFTTSSSGCNLALPSAVTWMGDTPTLDADTYYEVSIKNDKAVIG